MPRRNRSTTRHRSPTLVFGLAGAALSAAIASMGVAYLDLGWVWSYLVAINAAVVILYAWDKAAATREGRRRVPEVILHAFAALGGTPMAFVSQRIFRHKTRKRSFQVVFWSTVAAHVLLLALWHGGWA